MAGPTNGRDWVALVLAGGIAAVLATVTFAVVYGAIQCGAGLSENVSQVLTTGLAASAGVLGGYLSSRGRERGDGG